MPTPPSTTGINRSVWIDIAARRTIARAERAAVTPSLPADCVERFPTLSDDFVELVRFDSAGKVQLIVAVSASEDMSPFVRWMNSWGRRRDRKLRVI